MLRGNMIKVGGEVDAFCSKCELNLAHTVHAVVDGKPARVECNTCHATHRFKAPAGVTNGSVVKAKAKRPPREKKQEITFEQLLAAHKRAPVSYSVKRRFTVDDVMEHPTFGVGFVTAVRIDKIDVTFRTDARVLIHGRV